MDFAQIHVAAITDMSQRVEAEVSHGNTMRNYMIYLIILIPLYIITGYPHGYSITHHRRRSGCLNVFRKVGFAVASFCFGAGVALSLLPSYEVETTYSDGHKDTHTESSVLNGPLLFIKFCLMAVGAFLFCFVSSVVMTIETVYGLIENFNWSGWFRKVFPKRA